jgi:Ala-tRNA(Pro) deacylase
MKDHAIVNNSELLELLKKLGICYKRYKHQPIYNVADAEKYAKNIDGAHCKNLFLTDAKGKLYLAVTLEKKRVDLKGVSKQIGAKRLSFASNDILENMLNIKPGGVTPFALINDINKHIVVLFDQDILKERKLSFHPLVNTETITINTEDILKFINYCGHRLIYIENSFEELMTPAGKTSPENRV